MYVVFLKQELLGCPRLEASDDLPFKHVMSQRGHRHALLENSSAAHMSLSRASFAMTTPSTVMATTHAGEEERGRRISWCKKSRRPAWTGTSAHPFAMPKFLHSVKPISVAVEDRGTAEYAECKQFQKGLLAPVLPASPLTGSLNSI